MPFGSPLLLLALAASAPPPPGSLDKEAGEARRPRPRPGRRDRRSAPAHVGPAGLPAEEVNGDRACRRIQSGSVIAGWARRKRSKTSASVSGSTEAKRR